jgi:hypothetical protein
MIKSNGLFTGQGQPLIDHVQHFQKGAVRGNIFGPIGFKPAFSPLALLTPDLYGNIYALGHL